MERLGIVELLYEYCLLFHTCPPDKVHSWTYYPGGFYFSPIAYSCFTRKRGMPHEKFVFVAIEHYQIKVCTSLPHYNKYYCAIVMA